MAAMQTRLLVTAGAIIAATGLSSGQSGGNAALEAETLKHFQALIQADTSSPPGNEIRAVEYLKKVLDAEGIPYQVFAKDPQRPNLVVRIRATARSGRCWYWATPTWSPWTPRSGRSRRLARTLDGGYVYGRGTVDDKDNLVAGLMLVLQLHRTKAPLERDVILLAEVGRGRRARVRRAVHDRPPLRRHRRRVLPGRGRRRGARRRQGQAGQRRHHREGAPADRAHRERPGRPRLGAQPEQRRAGAWRRRSAASAPGSRRCASTRPPPRTSSSWRRCPTPSWRSATATCSIPTRRCTARSRTGCSSTSRSHWSMTHTSLVPDDHRPPGSATT